MEMNGVKWLGKRVLQHTFSVVCSWNAWSIDMFSGTCGGIRKGSWWDLFFKDEDFCGGRWRYAIVP